MGFALAGFVVAEARSTSEAARLLADLAQDPEVGVILIQQDFYDALPGAARRAFGRTALPIVVPFPPPQPAGEVSEVEAYLVEILRQAIGYRVRLR